MFNKKMFVEGFKLTFVPTMSIAGLAIICQFLAWEIGYIPAMAILVPGCYTWYRWISKRSKKLVEKMLHESEKEG